LEIWKHEKHHISKVTQWLKKEKQGLGNGAMDTPIVSPDVNTIVGIVTVGLML
jgi:hypothetical protein